VCGIVVPSEDYTLQLSDNCDALGFSVTDVCLDVGLLSGLGPPRTTHSRLKKIVSTSCFIHTVYLLMIGYRYAQNI
jgi:hypothetical protein